MSSEARLEIWDPRGRKHSARLQHEGGGLMTVALDASAQSRFGIGDRVRWINLNARRSPERGGTIASTYASGAFFNLVVSPEVDRNATPPMPRNPARSDRSAPAAPIRRSAIRPRATIVARGQIAAGDIRSLEAETVLVYVDGSPMGCLELGASVKLSIELPNRRQSLHLWARVRGLNMLRHGALCRLDLDSSVPLFEEQFAILARCLGRAYSTSSLESLRSIEDIARTRV